VERRWNGCYKMFSSCRSINGGIFAILLQKWMYLRYQMDSIGTYIICNYIYIYIYIILYILYCFETVSTRCFSDQIFAVAPFMRSFDTFRAHWSGSLRFPQMADSMDNPSRITGEERPLGRPFRIFQPVKWRTWRLIEGCKKWCFSHPFPTFFNGPMEIPV